MKFSNQDIAELLKGAAAALNIKKGNLFQIRAYETAADGIEHLTAEARDLWQEEKLDLIPGVGKSIQEYLDEYFKTGKIKHFETLKEGIPPVVFELLDIPGIGPKTALELAKLGVKSRIDLSKQLDSGKLVEKGFSAKIASKIALGLKEADRRTGRMLLSYAYSQAQVILDYLKKGPGVVACDPLGSLRRQVSTIGDLDFAAASKTPEKVVNYFIKMPGVSRVVGQGEAKATLMLHSGLHVDLLVGEPDSYGALLQHFTGSKHHNIKLRNYALKKGYSLSEYGVKSVKTNKIIPTKTEDDLYKMLGMQTPAPEVREDNGEIEAALKHQLPKLVEAKDIRGDFHLHSNFPLEPSHGPGADKIEEIIENAIGLGYEYMGISDHPPSFTNHSPEEIKALVAKRSKYFEQLMYSRNIRVLNGLEVDILTNGYISVPDEVLKTLDYAIAGVHSSHRMPKDEMTKRILTALANPYVDILAHPTGRLLNERESYDADWEEIFKFCAKNNKLLEIDSYPNRLDLRDDLAKKAKELGCKFIIDTDAHQIAQMKVMPFGVAVARRGWIEAKDVVNTWDYKKLAKWFELD